MDNNNSRPVQADQNMDATPDWRTQLIPGTRPLIVQHITGILQRHLPSSGPEGIIGIKKIAERIERRIYTVASSQKQYLRKICLKMVTVEENSQNTGLANAFPYWVVANENPADPGALDFESIHSEMKNQVATKDVPHHDLKAENPSTKSSEALPSLSAKPSSTPVSAIAEGQLKTANWGKLLKRNRNDDDIPDHPSQKSEVPSDKENLETELAQLREDKKMLEEKLQPLENNVNFLSDQLCISEGKYLKLFQHYIESEKTYLDVISQLGQSVKTTDRPLAEEVSALLVDSLKSWKSNVALFNADLAHVQESRTSTHRPSLPSDLEIAFPLPPSEDKQ